MNIEEMKAWFLDHWDENIKDIDFSHVPEFYFRRQVLNRLVQDHGFSREAANDIAGTITVEVPALGVDYRPHQEFLDALAERVANVAQKVWGQASDFGPKFTMRTLETLTITLKD